MYSIHQVSFCYTVLFIRAVIKNPGKVSLESHCLHSDHRDRRDNANNNVDQDYIYIY